jgi:TolB-like protein
MNTVLKWSRMAAVSAIAALMLLPAPLRAQDAKHDIVPVAVFPFAERGNDVKDLGRQVADLMFANLVADPDIYLVERDDIKKVFDELELNASGIVRPDQAAVVGQLTGAKILVTGSVLMVGDDLYVVAKVIGTETSRVLGASAKGNPDDALDGLVKDLAGTVAETIGKRAGDLVAKRLTREDRIAALNKAIGKGKRPSVFIDVEERHVGQVVADPAAQTELALFCKEAGFKVIDAEQGNKRDADVLLTGEGFSEFAARHGNLLSVKSRLEIKAVAPKSGEVLAVDRQTTVGVDLTELVAGKSALQEAAARIAERLLPRIVKSKKGK